MQTTAKDESLKNRLLGQWILYCKKAVGETVAGRLCDPSIQFREVCYRYGVPSDMIERIVGEVPWRLPERIKRLEASYRRFHPNTEAFFQSNMAWALPDELDAVSKNLAAVIETERLAQARRATFMQSPTTVQVPGSVSAPELIEHLLPSTPAGNSPRLISLAEKMAEAYAAFGITISVVPEECSEKGPKCDRLVFAKPLTTRFSDLEKPLKEALSNAEADPEADVFIQYLPGNRFELQVPRPPEQWRPVRLLDYLTDGPGIDILRKSVEPVQRVGEYLAYIRRYWNVSMKRDLRVPFMIDLQGRLAEINVTSHTLFGGMSGGGKSAGLTNVAALLMMLYPPEWLEIGICDFKEGLTFDVFNGQPQLLTPVIFDPEKFKSLFEEWEEEAKRRAALMKTISARSIVAYNTAMIEAKRLDEIMPWRPLIIDEVSVLKSFYGGEADAMLGRMLSQWRAAGMPLIAATQYPTKEQGLGTSGRENFGTRVAYKSTQTAAAYTLGENSPRARQATTLLPPGECIMAHSEGFTRGQTLFLEEKLLPILLQQLSCVHSVRLAPRREFASSNHAALLGGDDRLPGKPSLRVLPARGLTRRAVLEAIASQEKPSERGTLKNLFGGKATSGRAFTERQAELRSFLKQEFGTTELLVVAQMGRARDGESV